MDRPIVVWAVVPVVIWAGLLATGLLAGSFLCENPMAMVAFLVVAAAALARAVVLVRQERQEPGHAEDFLTNVAMKVGLLFTIGVAVTLAMVGLGPCL